jgi:hypothetical protein
VRAVGPSTGNDSHRPNAPTKIDASTQTEKDCGTETDLSPPNPQLISQNENLAAYLQASADAISWLLAQSKVPDFQKTLLSSLQAQFKSLTSHLFASEFPTPVFLLKASIPSTPQNTLEKKNITTQTKTTPGVRPNQNPQMI